MKYKRRVYKSIHLIEKNLNVKVNTRKFVEAIRNNQIGKVARYLDKGFDPNFHLSDDGKIDYFKTEIDRIFFF